MTEAESPRRGAILIAIARGRLASVLGLAPEPGAPGEDAEPWLYRPGATFVTLRRDGALRGCVGSLAATARLVDDLRHNAEAAALRDPRFAALEPGELARVEIEVSLLSATEPLRFTCEADARAQLRPGEDGVVLRWGAHRATFLPQVWDKLPRPDEFLAHLKHKAGLAPDFWDDGVRLERYRVRKWSEAEVR